MKKYDRGEHKHNLEIKIKYGLRNSRVFWLGIFGVALISLIPIICAISGEPLRYILLENQKINLSLWRILLCTIYTLGITLPVFYGFEAALFASILSLIFVGSIIGFYLTITSLKKLEASPFL